jgi:hypothetical protein
MRDLKRFWRSLEILGGCATVTREWTQMLGDEYQLARQFLRPSGELATFFPHPDPGICIYRVVTHGPDNHVAVCDETGETLTLSTEAIVIHQLDRPALERAVVAAFGFQSECSDDMRCTRLSRVGDFLPTAGYRFPVFLAITHDEQELSSVICKLVVTQSEPFVVVVPTSRHLSDETRQLLVQRRASFLPLSEATCIDDDGRLVASPMGTTAIERFFRDLVPQTTHASNLAFFSTPAGVSWADVKMRLVNGHTISVAVGEAHGIFGFADMGMSNRKNGEPTVQWQLLRDFAAGYGVLTWRSAGADRKNKKRRENLARDLQAFFRIDGDPFARQGNGWRTKFQIEPDR